MYHAASMRITGGCFLGQITGIRRSTAMKPDPTVVFDVLLSFCFSLADQVHSQA